MYTAPDFKEYIVANSGKDVTRGQISGAVSQLVDTKELATTISSIDIWKLNGENFEIVTKMCELKDFIEEIKMQCK